VTANRLDKLVQVRERSEDSALDNLARAQGSLGRAMDRLSGLRTSVGADAREAEAAALWCVEEAAHGRAVQALRAAERELANARRGERAARLAYEAAYRQAEAARRIREKKHVELAGERERRDQGATDDLSTMRFNSKSQH